MAEALHINNSRSAFLGSLFFFGYFLFQIPGAAYARRKSATRLIFFALISWGALAALTGDQSFVGEMVKAFAERRAYMYDRLTKIPRVSCVKPMGAFYMLPNISRCGLSSTAFCTM